jgi:hypothetical protein
MSKIFICFDQMIKNALVTLYSNLKDKNCKFVLRVYKLILLSFAC